MHYTQYLKTFHSVCDYVKTFSGLEADILIPYVCAGENFILEMNLS